MKQYRITTKDFTQELIPDTVLSDSDLEFVASMSGIASGLPIETTYIEIPIGSNKDGR